jgi:hypothetical protein
MIYTIKLKNRWQLFWKSYKVTGHGVSDLDRLILYMPDGSILEVPLFSKIKIHVCPKWRLTEQAKVNKEAGMKIF